MWVNITTFPHATPITHELTNSECCCPMPSWSNTVYFLHLHALVDAADVTTACGAKRMWPHAAVPTRPQTLDLNASWVCSHLYSRLCTCDQIAQGARQCQVWTIIDRRHQQPQTCVLPAFTLRESSPVRPGDRLSLSHCSMNKGGFILSPAEIPIIC